VESGNGCAIPICGRTCAPQWLPSMYSVVDFFRFSLSMETSPLKVHLVVGLLFPGPLLFFSFLNGDVSDCLFWFYSLFFSSVPHNGLITVVFHTAIHLQVAVTFRFCFLPLISLLPLRIRSFARPTCYLAESLVAEALTATTVQIFLLFSVGVLFNWREMVPVWLDAIYSLVSICSLVCQSPFFCRLPFRYVRFSYFPPLPLW